jgi:hypothetical protein
MRISGFTFVRNATKLYFPIQESIRSALPLVDEFVVALGEGDPDDRTREQIEAIGDPRIRVIPTQWDLVRFPNGTENAHQTDIAKAACTGDWLLYLQADEVLHEDEVSPLRERCARLLDEPAVEGLLFDYYHFWGDYWHYQVAHGWYAREIRIIRNEPAIHAWRSAQSFRRIPNFDGYSYRQKAGTYKLGVAPAHAHIYHYGWARPPHLMQAKRKALAGIHRGESSVERQFQAQPPQYDYGPLRLVAPFQGRHPAVMQDRIAAFDWAQHLDYRGRRPSPGRPRHKHEQLKNRLLTFVERRLLGGRQLFASRNYRLVRR